MRGGKYGGEGGLPGQEKSGETDLQATGVNIGGGAGGSSRAAVNKKESM